MFCNATLGGQIIKIIYEKDPTFTNLIKKNMYKLCTCICALKQKKVGTGTNKFYTYDFILEDINF